METWKTDLVTLLLCATIFKKWYWIPVANKLPFPVKQIRLFRKKQKCFHISFGLVCDCKFLHTIYLLTKFKWVITTLYQELDIEHLQRQPAVKCRHYLTATTVMTRIASKCKRRKVFCRFFHWQYKYYYNESLVWSHSVSVAKCISRSVKKWSNAKGLMVKTTWPCEL